MNYYERIQRSIDYIERNIEEEIILEDVAAEASMSLSNFYRIFFAVAGYNVKEYIRLRRISLAAADLKDGGMKIAEIAARYLYTSSDSFTRAFKKATGYLPSEYRTLKIVFSFGKIDIPGKYFDIQDPELLEKYPDIRVLKVLEPFYAASYIAFSRTPENDAFAVMKKWAAENGILTGEEKYRIFGFDVAGSMREDGVYGYEVWMTVPEGYTIDDDRIVSKRFDGGLYAVTPATIGGIVSAWDRFREWLKLSRYEMGRHQCLEEHLPFEDWEAFSSHEEIRIDLYMPLQEKREKTKEVIQPTRVAYYRSEGEDCEANAMKVWDVMLRWAKKNDLKSSDHRIYMYNQGFRKTAKYWHEIMITIDDDLRFEDDLVRDKIFGGGTYMTMKTDREHLPEAWHEMGRWKALTKTKGSKNQWIEEWILNDWQFPCNGVRVMYPVGEQAIQKQ